MRAAVTNASNLQTLSQDPSSKQVAFNSNVVQELTLGTHIKFDKSQSASLSEELLNICKVLNIDPLHLQTRYAS